MHGVEMLQKNKVEFNVLCVLSQANVEKPKEIYRFFRGARHRLRPVHSAVGVRRRRQPAAVHHHAGAVRALPVRDLRPVVAGPAQGAHPLLRQHRRGARRTEARAIARCTRPATATWWWSTTATSTRATSSSRSDWKLGNVNARLLARDRAPPAALQLRGQEDAGAPRVPGLRVPVDLPRRLPQVPPRTATGASRTWTTSARPTR